MSKDETINTLAKVMANSGFVIPFTTGHGITIRAYIAGQALGSYLASCNNDLRATNKEAVAITCCEYADALLAELAKEKTA